MKRFGTYVLMPAAIALPLSGIASVFALLYGYVLVHGGMLLLIAFAPFFSLVEGPINEVPLTAKVWFFLLQYFY
jgi:hypothetical protein